jgi:hypothetical protein
VDRRIGKIRKIGRREGDVVPGMVDWRTGGLEDWRTVEGGGYHFERGGTR